METIKHFPHLIACENWIACGKFTTIVTTNDVNSDTYYFSKQVAIAGYKYIYTRGRGKCYCNECAEIVKQQNNTVDGL